MNELFDDIEQLTDAEILATKLLGWESIPPEFDEARAYYHNKFGPAYVFPDGSWTGASEWPNLADWNTIRRIEDAIWGKGRAYSDRYIAYLTWSCEYDRRLTLRGTQEQRVAAALRVSEAAWTVPDEIAAQIEEAGL